MLSGFPLIVVFLKKGEVLVLTRSVKRVAKGLGNLGLVGGKAFAIGVAQRDIPGIAQHVDSVVHPSCKLDQVIEVFCVGGTILKIDLGELVEGCLDLVAQCVGTRRGLAASLEHDLSELELSSWFTDELDHGDAIVTIKPGQGGLEAQDWTFMLFKMYMKYCARRGWK